MTDTGGARRFTVVALFEPVEIGRSMHRDGWPAHVTLAGNFTTWASMGEIAKAVFAPILVVYPLVVRFGPTAQFGAEHDVPVQLLDHIPVHRAHDQLARRLQPLGGFVADEPEFWREGYRPHVTLGACAAVRPGETRRVHSIAVAEIHGADAVVRAIQQIEDLEPMDRVDMPVAMPVGEGPATVTVVARGADLEYPTHVTIETGTALRVSTTSRMGVRWRFPGWAPPEETLTSVATGACFRLLLASIDDVADDAEFDRLRKDADEEGQRLATLLRVPEVWAAAPVVVDGVRFALFSTAVAGGVAAVLDLGWAYVSMTGPRLPDNFALQLVPASRLALLAEANASVLSTAVP